MVLKLASVVVTSHAAAGRLVDRRRCYRGRYCQCDQRKPAFSVKAYELGRAKCVNAMVARHYVTKLI